MIYKAVLRFGSEIHWAAKESDCTDFSDGDSPVTRLLQGVFSKYQDLAFFRLRKKIYLNYKPHPFEVSMIKLVAKSFEIVPQGTAMIHLQENIDQSFYYDRYLLPMVKHDMIHDPFPSTFASLNEAGRWLRVAAKQIEPHPTPHDRERPIAALLLSQDLQPLDFRRAANRFVKTEHAEMRLLQAILYGTPQKAKPWAMIASLQPCRMCADFWYHTRDRLGLTDTPLYFIDADPSTKVRGSQPDRLGLMKQIMIEQEPTQVDLITECESQ